MVCLLALSMVLAGVAGAVLPRFALSPLPWVSVLIVAALYPMILSPFFRMRRADNAFRLLHVLPLLILLGALLLQLFSTLRPAVQKAFTVYTWGWSLLPVAFALLLLLLFCVQILRQRGARSLMLAALFVPFAILGVLSERQPWNPLLTASETNLTHSSIPAEEQWRMKLRNQERRQVRIVSRAATGDLIVPVHSAKDSVLISSSPPHLPSSGMGVELLVLTMLAGYCGVIHLRARQRSCGSKV